VTCRYANKVTIYNCRNRAAILMDDGTGTRLLGTFAMLDEAKRACQAQPETDRGLVWHPLGRPDGSTDRATLCAMVYRDDGSVKCSFAVRDLTAAEIEARLARIEAEIDAKLSVPDGVDAEIAKIQQKAVSVGRDLAVYFDKGYEQYLATLNPKVARGVRVLVMKHLANLSKRAFARFDQDFREHGMVTAWRNEQIRTAKTNDMRTEARPALIVCKAFAPWQPTSLRRAILTSPREMDTLHLARFSRWGTAKTTLCGKRVSRTLSIFQPREAGCRECKRRAGLG
jgi:hypothetical protein